MVVKPAELTPLSTLYACHLAEQVGIPAGVINVVPGLGQTAGTALSHHTGIRRMSFTGSPEVGREVASATARNLVPCKLELGGKGAAVVFDDVDVADTAAKLADAITGNTGQVCCTATRWVVHEDILDELVSKAKDRLAEVVIGPATKRAPRWARWSVRFSAGASSATSTKDWRPGRRLCSRVGPRNPPATRAASS